MSAYDVVKMFEEAVAEFTGAPYAVSVDSCTNALFLSLKYDKSILQNHKLIVIPKRTYLSVPQAIIHAGGSLAFDDRKWEGTYDLIGSNVVDSAKRFRADMYVPGKMMCLSFHYKKHLKIGKGGMVLTDDKDAADWIKKARYEGRSEGVPYHQDDIDMLGWNMYMTPEQAARGLALLQNHPRDAKDIPENPPYRDLTEFSVFKNTMVIP